MADVIVVMPILQSFQPVIYMPAEEWAIAKWATCLKTALLTYG